MDRVNIDRTKAREMVLTASVRMAESITEATLRGAKWRIRSQRYDTGTLYRSGGRWVRILNGKVTGRVTFSARHASMVHKGTRPHLIRPRRRTGMLFYWPPGAGSPPLKQGTFVCFKGTVHHPGMRGYPYLTMPFFIELTRHGFRGLISTDGI